MMASKVTRLSTEKRVWKCWDPSCVRSLKEVSCSLLDPLVPKLCFPIFFLLHKLGRILYSHPHCEAKGPYFLVSIPLLLLEGVVFSFFLASIEPLCLLEMRNLLFHNHRLIVVQPCVDEFLAPPTTFSFFPIRLWPV
jgi:hypothetical protein